MKRIDFSLCCRKQGFCDESQYNSPLCVLNSIFVFCVICGSGFCAAMGFVFVVFNCLLSKLDALGINNNFSKP